MKKKVFIRLTVIFLLSLSLFTLVPQKNAYATSITINPTSGAVGSIIQINGEDFAGKIGTVYFDDKLIAKDILISDNGKLSCSITVPAASKGSHTIRITDNSNWAGSVASINFFVSSGIAVYPLAINYSSVIFVSGYGFESNESPIKITLNGSTMNIPTISADKIGTWSTSIQLNNAPKGEHYIGAYGNTTQADTISPIKVTIYPWAKMEPLSGPVGTKIIVKAWGFKTNEDGVTLTWDGDIILTNIRAETDGTVILDGSKRQFAGSFDNEYRESLIVPPSIEGQHKIVLYGSSFTPKGIFPDFYFKVVPGIQLNPSSGSKNNHVKVLGTGFSRNESVELLFDDKTIGQIITTDQNGSFDTTIIVPSSKGRDHIILAKGARNTAKATFTTNNIELQPPQLKSPAANTEIAVFNSVGDVYLSTITYLFGIFDYLKGSFSINSKKAFANFSWINTEPINDTSYQIQISTKSDFSNILFEKQVKNTTSLDLTTADSLSIGSYYWRARSIDTSGSSSEWTESSKFSITAMPGHVFTISIIIFILIIAALIFAIITLWINTTRRFY